MSEAARPGRAAAIVVLAAACASMAAAANQGTTAIAWYPDLNRAAALARQERKPILLDFWAKWCGPCRQMEAELWSRPDVVALSSKFVCVRVDADRNPELLARYRAGALPTVVVSDPWGTEIARREGYSRPDDHLVLLKGVPGDFSPIAAWQERIKADPRNLQALGEIGRFYYHVGLYPMSKDYYIRLMGVKAARNDTSLLADTLTAIAWNDLRMGNARQARKRFEECLETVPEHPGLAVTLYGLFRVCLLQDKGDEARACLERLSTSCPTSVLVEQARRDLVHLAPGP